MDSMPTPMLRTEPTFTPHDAGFSPVWYTDIEIS